MYTVNDNGVWGHLYENYNTVHVHEKNLLHKIFMEWNICDLWYQEYINKSL